MIKTMMAKEAPSVRLTKRQERTTKDLQERMAKQTGREGTKTITLCNLPICE